MGKAPAFQFYVKDWLSDPDLRKASSSSKGIWIDLLCFMWQSNHKGIVNATIGELQKMTGAEPDEISKFLFEAENFRFANVTCNGDVTNCNTRVTVINRRMFREEKERENTRLRVQRYRSNRKVTPDVTPLSSSPSPSPSPNNKNIYTRFAEELYQNHPRKGAKADAIKNICSLLKKGVAKEQLTQAQENYINEINRRSTEPEYIIQANNFFGKKQRYRDYLDPEIDEADRELKEFKNFQQDLKRRRTEKKENSPS